MSKRKKRGGIQEILESGSFPGTFVDGGGWKDIASPRWWGHDTKGGPFAKQHSSTGQPIWSSPREFREACQKSTDLGSPVRAVRPRDYE